jgi:hypothetical protein
VLRSIRFVKPPKDEDMRDRFQAIEPYLKLRQNFEVRLSAFRLTHKSNRFDSIRLHKATTLFQAIEIAES